MTPSLSFSCACQTKFILDILKSKVAKPLRFESLLSASNGVIIFSKEKSKEKKMVAFKISGVTLSPLLFLLTSVVAPLTSAVECGHWYSKECLAESDIRYDDSISYNLKDQATIWNRLQGFYKGEISYLRDGKILITEASHMDPNAVLPVQIPYEPPFLDFLNITIQGSRAIFQIIATHQPAPASFCEQPVPQGMRNVHVGDVCGENGLAEVSFTGFAATYNKDGSAVSLPDESSLGLSSKVTAVDDHTWYGSIRTEEVFIAISAKCVDTDCDHYTADIDYFLLDGGSSGGDEEAGSKLVLSKKASYDRISSEEEFIQEVEQALINARINEALIPDIDPKAPCLLEEVGKSCPTEEEWCQYDPVCIPNNPFQEPDSSLKPGFIAVVVLLGVALVVTGLFLLHKKVIRDQQQRFKIHFASRVAESIRIECNADLIDLTPEALAKEFEKIDESKDGLVDKEELWKFLETGRAGMISKADFIALFDSIDISGDGQVDFMEFCAFLRKCNFSKVGDNDREEEPLVRNATVDKNEPAIKTVAMV